MTELAVFQAEVVLLIGQVFFDNLIKAIDEAKLSVLITQYQWKWNIHQRHSRVQRLGAAIVRAKGRGVVVKVLMNKEAQSHHLTRINRVAGDQLSKVGCLVKFLSPGTTLHAKTWVIDGRLSFVGSHNISARSLGFNEEVSVRIDSKEVAVLMTRFFERLWGA